MGAFEEALTLGQRAAESGEHELAGRYFASAAGLALDAGKEQVARQVYHGAGELFRRADCPTDAANSLHLALAIPASEDDRGAARVMLAGVLTSIGRFDAARQQCLQAEGAGRIAALDSLCSIALAQGDHAEAVRVVEALEADASEAAGWAARLRRASLLRLQGDFAAAEKLLVRLLPVLGAQPGGRGTVLGEQGELSMLRGEEHAPALWMQARAAFEEAGRRSLVLQAELGRVRSLMALDLTPLDHDLDEGLVWAEARGLALLALDLRRVLARLREDGATLIRVRDEALQWGLRPRAGKAELYRAELIEGVGALEPAQAAAALLAGDRPYELLARTVHAEVLGELSAGAGRNAAPPLLALAQEIGMEGVRARLHELLGR